MRHHRAALCWRELAALVKNVGDGLVNFADIVEERDAFHARARSLIQFECLAEYERIPRHSANVCAGYSIVRIDRVEQCLERRRSEALRKNAMTSLANR